MNKAQKIELKREQDTILREGKEYYDEGQHFEAHNYISRKLKEFSEIDHLKKLSDSFAIKQLSSLVSNKIEAYEDTINLLYPLRDAKHPPGAPLEETLGNLASAYKGLWLQKGDKDLAKEAAYCYEKGFQRTKGYWTGINAATMFAVIGQKAKSIKYTKSAIASVQRKLRAGIKEHKERYWATATLGEAYLLSGDQKQAIKYYDAAYKLYEKMKGLKFQPLSSSSRQLRILQQHNIKVPDEILKKFKPHKVVLFAGHMLDKKGSGKTRFPQELENLVRQEIKNKLEDINP